MLIFLTNFVLNVLLYASQHEGLQNCMQSLNFDLIKLLLVLTVCLDVLGEPLIEQLMRIKEIRHHKVEQCPKFCHIVLDRRTSEQQSVSRLEFLKGVPSLRQNILDSLGFVQNHELPLESLEGLLISNCQLIGSNDNMER